MVRSEGGRICFDFNNLRRWVKSLGALRIQSVLFSKLRVRRTAANQTTARAGATAIFTAETGTAINGMIEARQPLLQGELGQLPGREHPALIERRQHQEGKQNRDREHQQGGVALGGFLKAEVGPFDGHAVGQHPPGELGHRAHRLRRGQHGRIGLADEIGRRMELQSFGKLVEDLDARGIVTKRRDTKVKKYNGGIPFTYGPLAHFLKNRLYIGETGHKDKWFPGEHAAIVDRKTFEQVQQLLGSKSAGRKAHRTTSEALLMGKLYDDRGNRMSPSFSTNTGVPYRFYVSSALLRGRKAEVGSVGWVAAQAIENAVVQAVRNHLPTDEPVDDAQLLDRRVSRIELFRN
jgi:hypothetical protein